MLYHRFGSIKVTKNTNICLYSALKREYCNGESDTADNLMLEMAQVLDADNFIIQDFLQVPE